MADYEKIYLDCRPRVVEISVIDRRWLRCECFVHEWACNHRHRRWGPIVRCLTRHIRDHHAPQR